LRHQGTLPADATEARLIKAPQIAILDASAFLATTRDPAEVLERLREHCARMTLFVLVSDASLVSDVSPRIVFNGVVGAVEDDDGEEARPARPQRRNGPTMEARP